MNNPHAAAFAAIHARQTSSATNKTTAATSRSSRGSQYLPSPSPPVMAQGHPPASSQTAIPMYHPPPSSAGVGYSIPYYMPPPPPAGAYPQHPPHFTHQLHHYSQAQYPQAQYAQGQYTHAQYTTPLTQYMSAPPSMPVSSYSYPPLQTYPVPTTQQRQTPSRKREAFYCDSCEKEFFNRNAFEAHNNTHEKCSHPGCNFSASKKLVVAHYHSAHGQFSGSGYKEIEVEGMKFRVLLGTNPEEIQQWRAERRNKFPTAANIEKKKEGLQRLRDAGGLEPTKSLSKGSSQRKRDRPSQSSNNSPNKKNRADHDDIENDKHQNESLSSLSMPTDGNEMNTNATTVSKIDIDEGDQDGSDRRASIPCKFNYKGKTCSKGDTCPFNHSLEPQLCKRFTATGRCPRGMKCLYVHDKESMRESRNRDESTSGKSKNKLFLPDPNKGNLLRKLLATEIGAEESLLMQALHYLRQKRYFQVSFD